MSKGEDKDPPLTPEQEQQRDQAIRLGAQLADHLLSIGDSREIQVAVQSIRSPISWLALHFRLVNAGKEAA